MTEQGYAAEPLAVHGDASEIGYVAETGHGAVDAALRTLASVTEADPADQLPAFQATHRTLRETLTSIDEEG